MKSFFAFCLLFVLPFTLHFAGAQEAESPQAVAELEAQYLAWAEDFEASLDRQHGQVELLGGKAVLNVPQSFYYLNQEDAARVLMEAWGNPFGDSLGMLFPAGVSPLDDASWGVVISYDSDGYVSDKDAASTNYDKLLKDMQRSARQSNKQREELGYETVELVGWAEEPHYDTGSHKLYWARELEFGGNPIHTLNYNVRVLGRQGVLNLNAVAGMDQLTTVKTGMQEVITFAEFNAGSRYEDYNASTDRTAAYGVAGLVAGGAVASKLGLFAKIGLLFAKGGKFLIVVVLAAGGFVMRLLGGRN